MASAGDKFTYVHPEEKGFGEQAKGDVLTAEMAELDLKHGQEVTFLEYDADSGAPLIQWVDGVGIDRITTIDPIDFGLYFQEA